MTYLEELYRGFNLVIEKLLIPTKGNFRHIRRMYECFNLVIEKLLIPTFLRTYRSIQTDAAFQSRNRETFDSNTTDYLIHGRIYEFQSRNRETFDSN